MFIRMFLLWNMYVNVEGRILRQLDLDSANLVISRHSISGLWYPFLDTAIIASATSLILFHMPMSLKKGYIAQNAYCIGWMRF